MAINKDKKKEIVAKLSDAIGQSETMVFANFHGLSVAHTTAVRRDLTGRNVGYMVSKKTLLRRALDAASIEGDIPELEGEVALAYGVDMLEPAKAVFSWSKNHPENFRIVGGVFEGRFLSAEEMINLAKTPDRQTLYAQLANVLNAPISGVVMALDQVAKKKEAVQA